jgi:hypothetical protein
LHNVHLDFRFFGLSLFLAKLYPGDLRGVADALQQKGPLF